MRIFIFLQKKYLKFSKYNLNVILYDKTNNLQFSWLIDMSESNVHII